MLCLHVCWSQIVRLGGIRWSTTEKEPLDLLDPLDPWRYVLTDEDPVNRHRHLCPCRTMGSYSHLAAQEMTPLDWKEKQWLLKGDLYNMRKRQQKFALAKLDSWSREHGKYQLVKRKLKKNYSMENVVCKHTDTLGTASAFYSKFSDVPLPNEMFYLSKTGMWLRSFT